MWAINTLRRVSTELSNYQDERYIAPDTLDSYWTSLQLAYREILMQEALHGSDESLQQACSFVSQALRLLQEIEEMQLAGAVPSSPETVAAGLGRPRFEIPSEQISLLIESQFTVPQIADLIGVSVRTVYRRMSQYGLSIRSTYSELTDQELDDLTSDIHREFPMCGSKQMKGHLTSRGFRVQQSRVRESLRRIDPEGTVARRLQAINRRCYRVAAPRSLYHIDGNHKLIRYSLDVFPLPPSPHLIDCWSVHLALASNSEYGISGLP